MKFICQLSGIRCEVSGFSGMLPAAAGYVHPAHFLPASRIVQIAASRAAAPESFNAMDSRLLLSCILNLSGLVRSAQPIADGQDAIIAAKLDSTARAVWRILAFPSAHIERLFPVWNHAGSLENLGEILTEWNTICDAAENSFREINRADRAKSLVAKYHALAASPKRSAAARAVATIAKWAAIAGDFPVSSTPHPASGSPISLSDYWQEIIRAAASPASWLEYPAADIAELIDHCYERISVGDFLAHDLFTLLGDAMESRRAYILGGMPSSHTFSAGAARIILDESIAALENDEKAASALAALRASAPTAAPRRENYSSAKEFLIAKLAYGAAK